MLHAKIPKSSNNSCNVTASHTRQAAQIIQDLTDRLQNWEFSRTFFIQQCAATTAQIRPSGIFFQKTGEKNQIAEPLCTNGTTLENAPDVPFAPGTCKSTHENFGKPAKKYSDQLYL